MKDDIDIVMSVGRGMLIIFAICAVIGFGQMVWGAFIIPR